MPTRTPDRGPLERLRRRRSRQAETEFMATAARLIAALMWLAAGSGLAAAQDGPQPWQMDFQQPATYVMEYVHWFGWYTLVIVFAITVLVIGLLAWCIIRFNERANPVPSRITHNTMIEVLWTVLPVLILVAIAIPSFRLLYGQYDPSRIYADFDPETDRFMTVKVSGVQWAWDVSYSNDEDSAGFGVTEPIALFVLPIPEDQLTEGQLRNLSVDNPVVVPVGTFVRVLVTAEGDAIHSLGVPAFALKEDAVPGRINETYFKAERTGMFYGVCSELCGKDHSYMPIAFQVVSDEAFRAWAAAAPSDLPGAYQTLAGLAEGATEEQRLAAR
jgi:cytochrome c oxidase subunit 2